MSGTDTIGRISAMSIMRVMTGVIPSALMPLIVLIRLITPNSSIFH